MRLPLYLLILSFLIPALHSEEIETIHVSSQKETQDSEWDNVEELHIATKAITARKQSWSQKTEFEKNEYGIELSSLEKTDDLSSERRLFEKQFPKNKTGASLLVGKQQYFSGQFALNQNFSLNSFFKNDSSSYEYVDTKGTPYTPSDDQLSSYEVNEILWGINPNFQYDKWTGNISYDSLLRDEMAITKKIGILKRQKSAININTLLSDVGEMTFHARQTTDKFESLDSNLLNQKMDSDHFDLHSAFELNQMTVELNLKNEIFKKAYDNQTLSRFKRYASYLKGEQKYSLFRKSQRIYLKIEGIHDRASPYNKNFFSYQAGQKGSLPLYKNHLAVEYGIRSYQLIPAASMYFGNSSFVERNLSLPIERGWRYHVGPTFTYADFSFAYYFISEESKNRPILIGSSPSHARYQPIGAIWGRGSQINIKYKKLFELIYDYQDVLNDSLITWQRGRQIPSIPLHKITTKVNFDWKKWSINPSFTYTANEYRDLANSDPVPNHMNLSAKLLYKISAKTEIWLSGENILLSDKMKQNYSFEGSAGKYLENSAISQEKFYLGIRALL